MKLEEFALHFARDVMAKLERIIELLEGLAEARKP